MAYVDHLPAALLDSFAREMSATRETLLTVPTDRFTWYPRPNSMTLGGLANHLMNMPLWLHFILSGLSWDLSEGGPADRESAESTAELVALFDHNVKEARVALSKATAPELYQSWSLLQAGEVLFSISRVEAVHQVLLNHMALHRDQLRSYLGQIPAGLLKYPEAMFQFPESAAALAASGQFN